MYFTKYNNNGNILKAASLTSTLLKGFAIFVINVVIYVLFYVFFPEQIIEMHYQTGSLIILVSFDLIALNSATWLILYFNRKLIRLLERTITWESDPFTRLIVQVLGTSIIGFVIVTVAMAINGILSALLYPELITLVKEESWKSLAERALYFFAAVSIIYHAVYISIHFYKRWRNALLESEKLKSENLHAQLHTLQSQVNPHFLFNSLNALISVIDEDKNAAIEYVQKLAVFYRYLLQRQTDHLVLLNDEINFVNSYIYLQKKRFGDNYNVEINVDEHSKSKYIPTFTLQILLENTVKHNIVSSEKPLYVKIFMDPDNNLVMENNLQRKRFVEPSTEHGLNNIENRYSILSKNNIHVIESENIFRVIIPLMDERGRYESIDN